MKDFSKSINILMRSQIKANSILVIGGGETDRIILSGAGFQNFSVTNISDGINAESLPYPDNSYDFVFAHAVLHHCRSPQKAFAEMLRVCSSDVAFFEPNDSFCMRLLGVMGFSSYFEYAAVADHGGVSGGVMDGPIPNYIYRWNPGELKKAATSALPEYILNIRANPYWHFFVNEHELKLRTDTKIGLLTRFTGVSNFIKILHLSEGILNFLAPNQGNKFYAHVHKIGLQPWINQTKYPMPNIR